MVAGTDLGAELVVLDVDATIVGAQRESEPGRLAYRLRRGAHFAGSGDQSLPGWMFLCCGTHSRGRISP
jgi:hypothetical protein